MSTYDSFLLIEYYFDQNHRIVQMSAKRPWSSLELLSPTRQLLLLALKRRKRATADELAADCYLSVGAARQHLMALVMQGLLGYEEERRGPGRPRHIFTLSPEGEALFPRQTTLIARAVLRALKDEDQDTLRRVLDSVAEMQRANVMSRLSGKEGFERLREFANILEEGGYFPELERDGNSAILRFFHCPFMDVAAAHPEVCDAEVRCMARVLQGVRIERIAHMFEGDGHCVFRIMPESSPASRLARPTAAR